MLIKLNPSSYFPFLSLQFIIVQVRSERFLLQEWHQPRPAQGKIENLRCVSSGSSSKGWPCLCLILLLLATCPVFSVTESYAVSSYLLSLFSLTKIFWTELIYENFSIFCLLSQVLVSLNSLQLIKVTSFHSINLFPQGVDYVKLRLYIQNLNRILSEKKEWDEADKWYTDLLEVRTHRI